MATRLARTYHQALRLRGSVRNHHLHPAANHAAHHASSSVEDHTDCHLRATGREYSGFHILQCFSPEEKGRDGSVENTASILWHEYGAGLCRYG